MEKKRNENMRRNIWAQKLYIKQQSRPQGPKPTIDTTTSSHVFHSPCSYTKKGKPTLQEKKNYPKKKKKSKSKQSIASRTLSLNSNMEIDFNEYKLSSELRGHEDDVRFLISLSLSLLNIAKNFNYCQKKKKKTSTLIF